MKILIVEDEPSLREIMVQTLRREQYVVEQAADYASALDKIAGYDYDCILLDIMLPDGSGLQLLEELKRQRRRFEDPDGRVACQAMLSALHRQLTALQPGAWSEASPRRQEALTALLGDETARQLTALEQEVWFSDHPIEEPQRQQAQKLLEGTERLWRERVPAARRWKQRFLTCQVI